MKSHNVLLCICLKMVIVLFLKDLNISLQLIRFLLPDFSSSNITKHHRMRDDAARSSPILRYKDENIFRLIHRSGRCCVLHIETLMRHTLDHYFRTIEVSVLPMDLCYIKLKGIKLYGFSSPHFINFPC